MFLGDEDQFIKNGLKDTRAMKKKAQELLDAYGLSYIKATSAVDMYNFEDRKLVEIRAPPTSIRRSVVDETTDGASQSGCDKLFEVMRDVRAKGHCVIFISHDMAQVMDMSDRIASCATATSSRPST